MDFLPIVQLIIQLIVSALGFMKIHMWTSLKVSFSLHFEDVADFHPCVYCLTICNMNKFWLRAIYFAHNNP